MSVPARCSHCGHQFEAAKHLAGGYANCPSCKKATEVEGLRDPLWRLIQVGALVLILAAGWVGLHMGGPVVGASAIVGGLLLFWLISRSF